MAVYKKKGYKKEKKTGDDLEFLKKESTTAEVFSSLDEGASRIEKFLEKNQKWIFMLLLGIIAVVAGYMWYDSNVVKPKQESAANELVTAQSYFDKALAETDEKTMEEDFEKALNGADGKFGFLQVIDKYSGTKAENLANYYVGTIYYKQGKYKKAVEYLSKFEADDVLQPVAYGLIGNAFMQLDQGKDALDYYEKAAKASDNSFTAAKFYFKAGRLALDLGDKAKAKAYFEIIKNKYEKSDEARNIDVFLSQVE